MSGIDTGILTNAFPLSSERIKELEQEVLEDGKAFVYNAGDLGSILGSGRSPGEGNGYPLQYSCLENSMDRGAWQATVHGVAKSRTQLK